MKLLVTGGAGFIGSALVELVDIAPEELTARNDKGEPVAFITCTVSNVTGPTPKRPLQTATDSASLGPSANEAWPTSATTRSALARTCQSR